ncbi:MAG: GatB/YqeY domain-containing protein [Deltaproteobacteria bacterium]|nr:GatB/YqeY domain-containing protein [Deltaproteobacteria bacterium]MBW2413662.1 GatB/YqeY domain-containing protein [Deltaproteobacteria bacterium]
MSIADDVTARMKDAMRAKQATRLSTLRSVRAGFLNEMKKDGSDTLSDEACVTVLRKLEKQRKESIEAFEKAGRSDRADTEKEELAVLQEFLPSLADEATTRAWVEQAIQASGAAGAKEVGKVMGAVMKAHKGDVDGNLARAIAAELLAD